MTNILDYCVSLLYNVQFENDFFFVSNFRFGAEQIASSEYVPEVRGPDDRRTLAARHSNGWCQWGPDDRFVLRLLRDAFDFHPFAKRHRQRKRPGRWERRYDFGLRDNEEGTSWTSFCGGLGTRRGDTLPEEVLGTRRWRTDCVDCVISVFCTNKCNS